MDMVSQMMDKMNAAVTTQTSSRPADKQKSGDDGKDFNSMVQQKQKEAKNAPKTKTNTQGKGTEKKPADTTAAAGEESSPEITQNTYEMAAMLLSAQPVFVNAETAVQKTTVELEEAPELVVNPGFQRAVIEEGPQQETNNPVALLRQTREVQTEVREDPAQNIAQVVARYVPRMARSVLQEDVQTEEQQLPILETQEAQPLFQDVEAVPVKVAEPSAPIPLEENDGIQRLAARIENFLVQENGDRSVQLTLSPQNLGRLQVQITHSTDGTLHIQLNTSTERTANILQRGADSLQHLLTTDTRPRVEVQVRYESSNLQQYLDPNGQNSQQQQQQQQQQQRRRSQKPSERSDDFVQQLRLGLVGND